ncbi:hypothetical protein MBANPS3_008789 [Mucor bainieri]
MAASWDTLPSEILELILEHSDLYRHPLHISLVCRKWNALARQLYYRDMAFDCEEVEDVISFIRHLQRYPSLGELVKIIDFDDLMMDFDTNGSAILVPLMILCLNVTNIYMTSLPAYFWSAMMYLQKEGFAQHAGARDVFWTNVYGYKHHDPDLAEMIIYLPKHLSERPGSLGAVQLRSYHNAFAYQALEDALENCRPSLPAVRMRIANDRIMGGLPALDLSSVTKQPATKELTIFTHRITPADMKYLMYKFTHLKELEIWFPALESTAVWNEMTAKRWHSVDMTGRFFKYLSTIPEIHIASLNLPLADIDDYLSRFVEHMDAFNLELVYPVCKSYEKAQLGLTKRNSMAEQYMYEDEAERGTLKTILSVHSKKMLPSTYFIRLLQLFRNTTKKLTLSIEKPYDLHRTMTNEDVQRGCRLNGTFDFILVRFSLLKHLHVKRLSVSPFVDVDESIPNDDNQDRLSLDVFKFTECTINATALPQLSRRLQYIRNLQFLENTRCYIEKRDREQGLDLDYYIRMPFTRIHTMHFGSSGHRDDTFIVKVKLLSISKTAYFMGNIASAGDLTKETFHELADQRNHRDVPRKVVVIECEHLAVFKTDRWESDVLENIENMESFSDTTTDAYDSYLDGID